MQFFGENYRLFATINGEEILNHQFNNPNTYENMKLTTNIFGHAQGELKDISISGNFTFFCKKGYITGAYHHQNFQRLSYFRNGLLQNKILRV